MIAKQDRCCVVKYVQFKIPTRHLILVRVNIAQNIMANTEIKITNMDVVIVPLVLPNVDVLLIFVTLVPLVCWKLLKFVVL